MTKRQFRENDKSFYWSSWRKIVPMPTYKKQMLHFAVNSTIPEHKHMYFGFFQTRLVAQQTRSQT